MMRWDILIRKADCTEETEPIRLFAGAVYIMHIFLVCCVLCVAGARTLAHGGPHSLTHTHTAADRLCAMMKMKI